MFTAKFNPSCFRTRLHKLSNDPGDTPTILTPPVTDAKYFVDFSGAAYCAGTLGHGVENWDCQGEAE